MVEKMKKLIALTFFVSSIAFAQTDTIVTESTTDSTINSKTETTLRSPPPSAIIPTMNNSNSDLCTVGVAGAVQTQILGISAGATVRDMNCERLKLSKTLYDMGMKVAAVSVMCQDLRIFEAMKMAGTPCPYNGLIGPQAQAAWDVNAEKQPTEDGEQPEEPMTSEEKTMWGAGGVGALLILLLL